MGRATVESLGAVVEHEGKITARPLAAVLTPTP
jgi:hypothetical protein